VFSGEAAAGDPLPCSVEEFPSAAARLLFFPAPHIVLFRASNDPETGELQGRVGERGGGDLHDYNGRHLRHQDLLSRSKTPL
jgi:hypothetical protein